MLVHGDAAFAGQGVVAETLNLSQLDGYSTGGTIHLIINNQIGFTTGPAEARSSPYSTDVARMVQAPIFHVNGDDPDAAIRVAQMAFDYRQTFKKDVVIDMFCYRAPRPQRGGRPELHAADHVSQDQAAALGRGASTASVWCARRRSRGRARGAAQADRRARWPRRSTTSRKAAERYEYQELSARGRGTAIRRRVRTPRSAAKRSDRIVERHHDVSGNVSPASEIAAALSTSARQVLAGARQSIGRWASRWLSAAWCSKALRCDSAARTAAAERSSQRHLEYVDYEDGSSYVPMKHLSPEQARFEVWDSSLSEYAVMGFEFGYSVADPLTLVLWEAQFGDFVNGAQIMIDQLFRSAESKWGQPSGLVLLLPHGYEGQGPEHSSARIERFLTLCAENNMQVCNCTTPAQYFHLLRRQMHGGQDRRGVRKPLVVFTPKSLLRHAQGSFERSMSSRRAASRKS